jgi:hypothetical protein
MPCPYWASLLMNAIPKESRSFFHHSGSRKNVVGTASVSQTPLSER